MDSAIFDWLATVSFALCLFILFYLSRIFKMLKVFKTDLTLLVAIEELRYLQEALDEEIFRREVTEGRTPKDVH